MRAIAITLLASALACQPKQPLQPSFFTQQRPANAPLNCKETIACYAQCKPIVEECLLRCDDKSSYYDIERARAVSNCVAQNGCADPECERERCGEPIDRCTTTPRVAPPNPMRPPPPMHPPPMGPAQPPPPPYGEPMPPQPMPR